MEHSLACWVVNVGRKKSEKTIIYWKLLLSSQQILVQFYLLISQNDFSDISQSFCTNDPSFWLKVVNSYF